MEQLLACCARLGVGLALLLTGLAVQAAEGPIKLNQTELRTVLRDRQGGVQHELVYRSNGPVLDERHLRRNVGDKPDGRVHVSLEYLSETSYLLTMQSMDTGRADRYHGYFDVVLGKACCSCFYELSGYDVLRNDLADTPNFSFEVYSDFIRVRLDKGVEGPFHFLGGQFQAVIGVAERCG